MSSRTDSIQLYLNSKYADIKPVQDNGICVYYLPQIDIPDGHYIYLSLQSAVIPYSFYSINSTNNTLIVYSNSTTYTVVVPEGNYNITQMITALLNGLGGLFSITYNSITNKITITNTTYDFTIKKEGTINHALGFLEKTDTSSISRTLTSTYIVNLNQIRAVNVEIDMPTYNINVAQKLNQNILATIPVVTQPFGMIYYENNNNFRINMWDCKIDSIRIKMIDNYGNLISFNGVNYQLTLQIDIVEFT
jgi:hypothetical protein